MTLELEISNLHFSYEKQPVITGLSLHTSQTGIIGLLGLNGEGKSTLLKLLAGILPANSANIRYSGTAGKTNPVGYLSERPLFYPELNVTENIRFAAQIQGTDPAAIKQLADDAIKVCQLADRRAQLAGNLSKGFQQRLGLAMAVVHKPELLLLDEPTDGLDPQQIADTHQLIKSLAEQCTVIISSHRLDEISQLCSRLLILHNGKFVHDADFCDQQQRENITALFNDIINSAGSNGVVP